MQPFQWISRCSAAKGTSITHAAVAPRNLDAAITMRFATSLRQPASLYAHCNKTWQHSCSHSNTICKQRFNKRIELRAHEEALLEEHRGGTDSHRIERSRTRRIHEVPFIAGATLHGKTQGFVPKLSPKTKPMQHPCSHYNAFCNLTSQTRISLRTWQHNMATVMQPFHCDLQAKVQQTHRTS